MAVDASKATSDEGNSSQDERRPLLTGSHAQPSYASQSPVRSTQGEADIEAQAEQSGEDTVIDVSAKDQDPPEARTLAQKIRNAICVILVVCLFWVCMPIGMVLRILTVMPLLTVINYQYRYGSSTSVAVRVLYENGGFSRYYQGLLPYIVQGPVFWYWELTVIPGILGSLQSNPYMAKLPFVVKVAFNFLVAAALRMVLTPIDTIKTTMQAQGRSGLGIVRARIKEYGIGTLWYGAFAMEAARFVGFYSFVGVHSFLGAKLPHPDTLPTKLFQSACLGFVASVISDTISNYIHVVKTYRQVNETPIGYVDAAKAVVAHDGTKGPFVRGLKTRIIMDGLRWSLFVVS